MKERAARAPLRPPAPAPDAVTAKFFRVLGDPTRLRVLRLLEGGERSVGELTAATGALQGRLSSHLACLRWCGLVTWRPEGRRVYYTLGDERVREILRLAGSFLDDNAASVEMCQIASLAPHGRGRKRVRVKEGDTA